ncbi:MAG: hypothetical protein LC667_15820, partial [Thioalkalivibrio sp.]|nr:hypothetical protein [Thioalkalivibrio sp.]
MAVYDDLVSRASQEFGNPLPQIIWLSAKTGRGKTYAVQRFYDRLAERFGGYWLPGMTPPWPPADVASVHAQRKVVTPSAALRQSQQRPSFLWIGVPCGQPAPAGLAATVVAQVIEQVSAVIEAEPEKLKRVARAELAMKLGKDIVNKLLPYEELGTLLAIGTHFGAYRREQKPERYRERLLELLLGAVQELQRVTAVPSIVVTIDDAHLIDDDTLYLLSSLVTGARVEDSSWDDIDLGGMDDTRAFSGDDMERSRPFLNIDTMPIAPVMFVATTWPHRMNAKAFRGTPFHRWWLEAECWKMATEVPLTEGLDVPDGEKLLVAADLPEEQRTKLLGHLSENRTRIVPLVLADNMARLEQQRDGLTKRVSVDDTFIDALPSDPSYHIIERISELNDQGAAGQTASGLLSRLAQWGPRPPQQLAPAIFEARDDPWAVDTAREALGNLTERGFLVPAR